LFLLLWGRVRSGFGGQGVNLFGRQVPPRAGGQAAQADGADLDARQALDGVANGGEHPAHLAVAALEDGQFDLGVGLGGITQFAGGGPPRPQ